MDWPIVLLIIFGSLIVVMVTGLPVAFCFIAIDIVGALWFWGGTSGLEQLILSFFDSVATFTYIPLPLFILMGEVLFHSGVAPLMMEAVDKWLGRVPGRLSLLAVASGTLLATLTGASMASVAMLGSTLVPEMEKRGYKKPMTLGPIMGSGGLAVMIPPSGLAVLIGALGEISIGRILMAIIMPGLLMAVIFAAYIILRCKLQPSLAPMYDVKSVPLKEKTIATVRYILPIGLVIFLVIGIMFLGVATPSEAAATGAIGTFILAALYGRLNWGLINKAFMGTINISIMMMMIIVGSHAFSQIIAFSGASAGLAEFVAALPVAPIAILIAMQIVLLILGMFMSVVAIMMITVPIFIPVASALGFDLVWFAVIYLVNMEVAAISPPFGLSLFVMKSVAPAGTTMADVFKGALPFCYLDLLLMAIIIIFPQTALWLPNMMIQ